MTARSPSPDHRGHHARRWPALAGAILLLLFACRGRSNKVRSPSDALTTQRTLLCEASFRCCGSTIAQHLVQVEDASACAGATHRDAQGLIAELGEALAQGKLKYDASAAELCIKEIRRATSACDTRYDEDSCAHMLTGTVAAGGACSPRSSVSWCSPGTYCKATGETSGICTRLAKAGDACTGGAGPFARITPSPEEQSACGPGLRCLDGRCAELLAEGRPCTATNECESGFCVNSDGQARCAPYTLRRALCTE